MPSLTDMQSVIYEDCPYTNFPEAVDTITRKRDVDLETKSLIDQYYSYVNSGDFTSAAQLLSDNASLRQTVMTSEDWNRVRDGLIAVQRVFNGYVADYIAAVVKAKGAWSETATYSKYDVVTYLYREATRTYICLPQDETLVTIPAGTLPTDTTYWACITLEGARGASGTGLAPRGAYLDDVTYYANDLVLYNGVLYTANAQVYGETPSSDSANWTALSLNGVYDELLGSTTIAATDWVNKSYSIQAENVTEDTIANVFFAAGSIDTASLAGIQVETTNGAVVLTYFAKAPETDIEIECIRLRNSIDG